MHHLEDKAIIGDKQYGSRPGWQCQSAVLQKVLIHEITRATKIPAAVIENEAVGCYDHLVNCLILLLLHKFGLPTLIRNFLGSLWDNTTHHIQTQFGTSKEGYHSTSNKTFYGPGQGSTCSPIFCLLCWLVIYASLTPDIKGAVFQSVYQFMRKSISGVSFVDDTGLATT
jgi:hypothetical protein